MADINIAYTFLANVWTQTTIFSLYWVLNIILTFLTSWLITRDINRILLLLLPVTIAWHIFGVPASAIWYIIITIIFVVKAFSINIRGGKALTLMEVFKVSHLPVVDDSRRLVGLISESDILDMNDPEVLIGDYRLNDGGGFIEEYRDW